MSLDVAFRFCRNTLVFSAQCMGHKVTEHRLSLLVVPRCPSGDTVPPFLPPSLRLQLVLIPGSFWLPSAAAGPGCLCGKSPHSHLSTQL